MSKGRGEMTSLSFKEDYIYKYNFGVRLFIFLSLIDSINSLLSQNAINYLSVDLKMKWCLKCICALCFDSWQETWLMLKCQ